MDYLDSNPYIVDPKFRFRTDSMLHKVNWRNIERINLGAMKTATFDDINTVFKQNLMDIAFCDLKEEQNCVWISNEGMEAMKVMQLGMQYLLF